MSSRNNTTDLTARNSRRPGGISTAVVYTICQTGASVKPRVQYPPIDDSLDDLCLNLDWKAFVTNESGGVSSRIQLAIAIFWVPLLLIFLVVSICELYSGAETWVKMMFKCLPRIGAAVSNFVVLPGGVFPEERRVGARRTRTIRMLDVDA